MPVQTALLAVLPAFLISAAVLAALLRPWSRGDRPRAAWAGAVAVAMGFIVADWFVWRTWPGLWPAEEHRRLPLVALGAMVAGIVDCRSRGKVASSWYAWAVGAVLMLPILWGDLSRRETYPQSLLWWLLCTGVIALIWSEVAATASRVGGVRVPLVLCVAALGTGLVIIQSYALSLGLTAAAVGATMVAFAARALWRPGLRAVPAATPVYATLLTGLLVCSHTGLKPMIFCLLATSTATLGDKGPLARLRPWMATGICVLLTAGLIALAIRFTPGGFEFGEGGGDH